jgi:CheY-like chemotaxis protein
VTSRILVVDDEEDVRTLLRLQLQEHGFEVAGEAADGNEALAHCRESTPDAVILDLLMPVANGFDAIPRLRREHPDLPIVAYTAVAGDFVRGEMERLGIPLVLKTANFRPIAAALERAMGQRNDAT